MFVTRFWAPIACRILVPVHGSTHTLVPKRSWNVISQVPVVNTKSHILGLVEAAGLCMEQDAEIQREATRCVTGNNCSTQMIAKRAPERNDYVGIEMGELIQHQEQQKSQMEGTQRKSEFTSGSATSDVGHDQPVRFLHLLARFSTLPFPHYPPPLACP